MAGKKKNKKVNHDTSVKKKLTKQKVRDFSDDKLTNIDDGDGEIFHGIRIPAESPPIISAEGNPGPRMIIKNIIMNNFKSFYGKVTIGPLHKSLTSIICADSSGKSNVIDSLLFVFGYQSTKIQSKKVSVLIHNSEKHKDVGRCSVTVNLVLINHDDSQSTGFVPIPDSEITITRTAFKDDSSFYILNNKRVKFKEVAIFLKKKGIDLIHNRFLILQNEVEQIAMMKPKAENEHSTGLLEYLENVIGTVKYKNPLIKLEEKVKVLAEEKKEKMTYLKFIAKERDELTKPAMAVINYLKMENLCSLLFNKLNQILINNEKKIIKTKIDRLSLIKEKLYSIKTELVNIVESKDENQIILEKNSKALNMDIKKSINIRKKYDTAVENYVQLVNDTKLLEEQKKNYEETIKTEKKKISKAETVPELKEAELKNLQSQIASLEKECIKLEENHEKVYSNGFEKSIKLREEKNKLAQEELKLQKFVGSKQNKFQTLKTECEVLMDPEKSEREKLGKLEKKLTKGKDEFEKNTRKQQKTESDIQNCRDIIKDLEVNIKKLKNDEQQIQTNLNNILQSLTEKRSTSAETTECIIIKGKIGPHETTTKYSGGNTSQVSQKEVESLDKISKDLDIELRETQSNIYASQSNIEKNQKQIEELNTIVKQCSLHLNTWNEKENQIKKLIKDQLIQVMEKSDKTDQFAIVLKKIEIKDAEKELERAQVKYDEIKSKMNSLKKRIADITEDEPKEAKRLLDEATDKLETTRNGINLVNVDIQASKRQIKKCETRIKKLTGFIDECKEKIESNNEKIKKNGKFMEEKFKSLNELGISIDEQNQRIKNIKDEEDEYKKRVNELHKDEIPLMEELNEIESIVTSSIKKCRQFNLELSKLKLHKIPKIDKKHSDPVIDSYKTYKSQDQKLNSSTLNKDNENEQSKKSERSPVKKDQPNQMQVDNDEDITHGSDFIKFPQYTDEQLESFNFEKTKYDYVIAQEKLQVIKPNFSVLEEYERMNQRYNKIADEVAGVLKLHYDHKEMVNKVQQRRKDEFMAYFIKISIKVKELYQMMTLGGDAELELGDSLDPFTEGVNFSVKPPKKTWKVISNLSGGEKTLSSLALVFALHYLKPSPLYIMDEMDAALDFKNVSIIAHYIKDRTKNAQFISISLHPNMFEKADILVGIFKTNDCTDTVSINTNAYEQSPANFLAKNTTED